MVDKRQHMVSRYTGWVQRTVAHSTAAVQGTRRLNNAARQWLLLPHTTYVRQIFVFWRREGALVFCPGLGTTSLAEQAGTGSATKATDQIIVRYLCPIDGAPSAPKLKAPARTPRTV